jgi:hypothetical protein
LLWWISETVCLFTPYSSCTHTTKTSNYSFSINSSFRFTLEFILSSLQYYLQGPWLLFV